jgi:malonate-semialdehyde dehydrogenase (acetylating)/methylmalonate-semialdehyde dehydrogenase
VPTAEQIPNYVNGAWSLPNRADYYSDVINPATGEMLARSPSGGREEVAAAVDAASAAFPGWRRTPPQERIQFLFRMKGLLTEHTNEIARTISIENGKTVAEARAELQRAIENVEVACGIPTLMQGYNLEDVARGIDEIMIRQPLGVVAAITPFNFPAMIPFWFLPYAIACGNTFILKPSERVPLTMKLVFELFSQLGFPPGVLNMVNGGKDAVNALLDHPDVRAISFVGSTPVAKYVYARGSANGKRVQCQGGAKNFAVVMPDADMETATTIVSDSAFGCAGQRCLAISAVVAVGAAQSEFRDALVGAASRIKVGSGLDESVHMGPVISQASKERIERIIGAAETDGAKVLLDGRRGAASGGYFLNPTVLDGVQPTSEVSRTEVFGPVLSMLKADSVDDALNLLATSAFGNAASIFTSSGATARRFRYDAPAGNIGVNIGIAAPMAYFPFSGWKDSFMGVLHGQGRDGVEFYTDKKVVIERWPKEWSRKF